MKYHKKKDGKPEDVGLFGGATPEIFRFARLLRARMTEPEKLLWAFLRTRPEGCKFRRQHPYGKYILDFYCPGKKLSIEIDGAYHNSEEQKVYDELRTEAITNMGIAELRFTNEEVLSDFEAVKTAILTFLKEEGFGIL